VKRRIELDFQARPHLRQRAEAFQRRERVVGADPQAAADPGQRAEPDQAAQAWIGVDGQVAVDAGDRCQAAEVGDPRTRDPQIPLQLGARTVVLLEPIDLKLGRQREMRQEAVGRRCRASDHERESRQRRDGSDDADRGHSRSSRFTIHESRSTPRAALRRTRPSLLTSRRAAAVP
jgi:hypothetical protein